MMRVIDDDDKARTTDDALRTRMPVGDKSPLSPHAALWRSMLSEWLRIFRTGLISLHMVCGLLAGLACGAYFAVSVFDPRLAADAFFQLLGEAMPLMAAIVCGVSADKEREAGGYVNLFGVPSRRSAFAGKIVVLWLLGFGALALAGVVFAGVLTARGVNGLSFSAYILAVFGITFGSLPLYMIFVPMAVGLGRNVVVGLGAVGTLLASLAMGGVLNGLNTGTLSGLAASDGVWAWVPFTWQARMGALGIEQSIIRRSPDATVMLSDLKQSVWSTVAPCGVLTFLLGCLLFSTVNLFENRRTVSS